MEREKVDFYSLTGKMVKRLLEGLGAGIFLILLLYFGSVNMLQEYFLNFGYLRDAEAGRAEELQEYIKRKKLSTTDTEELRTWAEKKKIDEFTVSREDTLLFDISYAGKIRPGSKQAAGQYYFDIVFEDGNAYVYLNEGFAEKYYQALLVISILLGFAACLGIFISGLQEDVRYIQCLEKEVSLIGRGNLTGPVTIQGRDELGRLAAGLDDMRRKLMEKEQKEKELRSAQEKLVLGMSHDLRTPLTGLLTYMEILKKQEKEGGVSREYIRKAYDKILEIRNLSDEMFEYFFIEAQKKSVLEPPEEMESALGDYLSELYAILESSGFSVNVEELCWKPVWIAVNRDYLGRIVNNMISNIVKYGNREREVKMKTDYCQNHVEILVQNHIAAPEQYVSGTGIGVKNISMMMEQMGGRTEARIEDHRYQIRLSFPMCENH